MTDSAMTTLVGEYQPGACNIGPAEIARRHMVGHVGTMATAGLIGVLVALDAPPATRLLTALPAMVAASGYIQARLRFCAGLGSRGVYNFGRAGETTEVVDPAAAAADRRRSRQISLASFAVGLAVGTGAALLPV